MWTVNFQMFKVDLEKAEEPQIKLPTSIESLKKQKSSRKNVYFYFIDFKDYSISSMGFSKPGFNSTWTMNIQMLKLDLEKAEEPEIKFPASIGS